MVSTGWDFAVLERFHYLAPSGNFHDDGLLIATGHYSLYDPAAAIWLIGGDAGWIREIASVPGMWCRAWGAVGDGVIYVAGCEGIFRSEDGGDSWEFLHPGVNLSGQRIPSAVADDGTRVALYPQTVSRYEARYHLLENGGGGWRHIATLRGSVFINEIWVSPDFASERVLIGVGGDFGGVYHVVSWRDGEPELSDHSPPGVPASIPAAYRDSAAGYSVSFAPDFSASRRVTLRHGANGATYSSDDAGITWHRADPIAPGECNRRPQGDFADLWGSRDGVRLGLGCPVGEVEQVNMRGQEFERGAILHLTRRDGGMYWRFVVADDGWRLVSTRSEPVEVPIAPDGLLAPDADFLWTWARDTCCVSPDEGTVRERIGWAIAPPFEAEAELMPFEGGFAIRAGTGGVLALYQAVPVWERQSVADWPLFQGDAVWGGYPADTGMAARQSCPYRSVICTFIRSGACSATSNASANCSSGNR